MIANFVRFSNLIYFFLFCFSGLAFIFLFPIVQILCFLYAVGGDIRDIKLAVVNDETMNYACNRTNFTGTATPYSFSSCHFTDMSCRFLKHLDEHPMMKLVSMKRHLPCPFTLIISGSCIQQQNKAGI